MLVTENVFTDWVGPGLSPSFDFGEVVEPLTAIVKGSVGSYNFEGSLDGQHWYPLGNMNALAGWRLKDFPLTRYIRTTRSTAATNPVTMWIIARKDDPAPTSPPVYSGGTFTLT